MLLLQCDEPMGMDNLDTSVTMQTRNTETTVGTMILTDRGHGYTVTSYRLPAAVEQQLLVPPLVDGQNERNSCRNAHA